MVNPSVASIGTPAAFSRSHVDPNRGTRRDGFGVHLFHRLLPLQL
jgi:hypothetical protein